MATAALSSIVQQQQAEPEAVAVPSPSAWKSSGSFGPFFAVITVFIILSVLSCYLGRNGTEGRSKTPLESIRGSGFFEWLKRVLRERIGKDVEVGGVGARVMTMRKLIIEMMKLVKNARQFAVHGNVGDLRKNIINANMSLYMKNRV
ncbi:LOW QUALITY PROTEIN: hypothetical protein GLYMA_05G015600v4 [Glycine max]|uniref:Uncharacterized protein n=1 Tax=Glycine max TaxID=3847 RepID=A0A0R0JUV9_SOYBN|nr:LOW QUALITY PROTEIN: hypothetical protein GLYMA_05G015600v4 [Glycine max]